MEGERTREFAIGQFDFFKNWRLSRIINAAMDLKNEYT